MNKIKLFFFTAAIVLAVTGVLAGRNKFSVTGTVYAYNSSVGYVQLSGNCTFPGFSTGGTGSACTITDSNGNVYTLYLFTPLSTYTPLHSTVNW